MIEVLLVRHGNTFEAGEVPRQVGARSDLPLTQKGKEQAEAMASRLSATKICPKAIYAGELQRQRVAAEMIGHHLGVKHSPALTEIDYGLWEGLTSEEIGCRWPEDYARWTMQGVWAESIFGTSLCDHMHHINQWIDDLRTEYAPGDTVVGVTSNGVMRLFYSLLTESWQHLSHTKQIEKLKVNTGHFCRLHLSQSAIEVKDWNVKP